MMVYVLEDKDPFDSIFYYVGSTKELVEKWAMAAGFLADEYVIRGYDLDAHKEQLLAGKSYWTVLISREGEIIDYTRRFMPNENRIFFPRKESEKVAVIMQVQVWALNEEDAEKLALATYKVVIDNELWGKEGLQPLSEVNYIK